MFDMPFEELALKFPKVAAERISVSYHLYCKEIPPSGMVQLSRSNRDFVGSYENH